MMGALERGGVGQLHAGEQIPFVLRWYETGRDVPQRKVGRIQQGEIHGERDDRSANGVTDQMGISSGAPVKDAVEASEKPAQRDINDAFEEVRLGVFRFEQEG